MYSNGSQHKYLLGYPLGVKSSVAHNIEDLKMHTIFIWFGFGDSQGEKKL
jgi:hypothetical protein